MENDLLKISGFKISELPFHAVRFADLIYFEGPLMSLHLNSDGELFVFDWVDADSLYNRWLVYEVDPQVLKSYISGDTPHIKLINSALKDVAFIVDIDEQGRQRDCTLISTSKIPYSYLPKADVYFDAIECPDLDSIITELDQYRTSESSEKNELFDIYQEALNENGELINIHFHSTPGKVGVGKIYSSILGQVLVNYQNLSFESALQISGSNIEDSSIQTRRKKGELARIKQMAECEFAYAKAGSFSVFLKPIINYKTLFDDKSSYQRISDQIFSLFEASDDISKLNKINESLNNSLLKSYHHFLKVIRDFDISVSLQYASPSENIPYTASFTKDRVKGILNNLDHLQFQRTETITRTGNFKALDALAGSFKFHTKDGDEYHGKFSSQLKDGIQAFNFQDNYRVGIEINSMKKSGTSKIIEKDRMVSCVRV